MAEPICAKGKTKGEAHRWPEKERFCSEQEKCTWTPLTSIQYFFCDQVEVKFARSHRYIKCIFTFKFGRYFNFLLKSLK